MDAYEMNGYRNTVLIINNVGESANEDKKKILDLFVTHLGFANVVEVSATKFDEKTRLKGFGIEDFVGSDCFVCVLLTKSDQSSAEKVVIEDEILNDILKYVKNIKSLVGKPKLFFVMACQNKALQKTTKGDVTDARPDISRCALVPTEADALVVYSHISSNENYNGSSFIDALDIALREGDNTDILNVITEVFGKITSESNLLVPVYTSTLTKNLYLANRKMSDVNEIQQVTHLLPFQKVTPQQDVVHLGIRDIVFDPMKGGFVPRSGEDFTNNELVETKDDGVLFVPDKGWVRRPSSDKCINQVELEQNACSYICGVLYDPLRPGWVQRSDRSTGKTLDEQYKSLGNTEMYSLIFLFEQGWVKRENDPKIPYPTGLHKLYVNGMIYDPMEGGWVSRKSYRCINQPEDRLECDSIVYAHGTGWVRVEDRGNHVDCEVRCPRIDGLHYSSSQGCWVYRGSPDQKNKKVVIPLNEKRDGTMIHGGDKLIYDPFRGGWIERSKSDYKLENKVICWTNGGMIYDIENGGGWIEIERL